MSRSLKILHGPSNVGDQAWRLSQAERALGHDSQVWLASPESFYPHHADKIILDDQRPGWRNLASVGQTMFDIATRFDVVHFYFGRSFTHLNNFAWGRFSFADLKLAKAMGKTVYITLQGCDLRLASVSNQLHEISACKAGACRHFASCIDTRDGFRQRLMDEILPLADRVFVLNPDLLTYYPNAEFLPYAAPDPALTDAAPETEGDRIKIVHAPSDTGIKGTTQVLQALQAMKDRGWPIDIDVVSGLTYPDALERYRAADLCIDQVLAGWYGAVAVECMALGKPVACYIRPEDLANVRNQFTAALPIYPLSLASLEEDLQRLLEDKENWPARGRASQSFIQQHHNAEALAKRLLETL
ncbi:glycosyltransferase [Hyphobacterium sp.]|uniref:glycosyltransferase n=1 Tax=Hyphobacterium sp. TaxID=2004662 RepID=UPI003BAB7479